MLNKVILILALLFFVLNNPFYSQKEKDYPTETVLQQGHIQPIKTAAFHPSGDYFATGGMDHSIKLWNVKSGKQIRSINFHTAKVNTLQFSKDGSQLLSSGMDNWVYVTETATGLVLEQYHFESENSYPLSVVFSKDERFILLGDERDELVQFDRENNSQKSFKKGYSSRVHSNSINTDGNLRLVLHNAKTTYLVNDFTKDTIEIPFDKAKNYSFAPDGKTITISSTKIFANIFETKSGKLLHNLVPSDKKCDGCNPKIAYSNNSKLLAFQDGYNGLTIWNVANGKKKITIPLNDERFTAITFSIDDKLILLSNAKACRAFDIASKKEVFQLKSKLLANFGAVLHPDGKRILISGENFTTDLYSISSGRVIKKYKGYANLDDAANLSFDYSKWTDASILNLLKSKVPFSISPNGKLLAIGKVDTSVVVVNLETGKRDFNFDNHSQQVFAMAFSPNGKELATADASGEIFRWNLETGKLIHQIKGHFSVIFDLCYNSKSNELLSCGWDGNIKHWDLENNDLIGKIYNANLASYNVSFSKNDLYIIASDLDNGATYYETDSKQVAKTIIGHTKPIADFELFSSGKSIATGSKDGTLKIWDFNTSTLVAKTNIKKHAAILSLAVSKNNKRIYFGSADRNIYCYNIESEEIEAQFLAHQSGVVSLEIHPQDNTLFSRGEEGDLKIWNLGNNTEQLSYMQLSSKEWLVTEPNGHFDGTAKAMKYINYVNGIKALEVGSLFKEYYYPGLFEHLQQGNSFIKDEQGINSLMDEVPDFEIQFTNFQNQNIVAVEDTVYKYQKSDLNIDLIFQNSTKNIDKISVFNNGKLIQEEPFTEEVVFRGSANKRTTSVVLAPDYNHLQLSVTTKEGVSTPKQSLSLNFDTLSGQTELFILSLGINQYENDAYNLKYAKNDAQSFGSALSQSASSLYSEVYNYSLLDKNVTKQKVEKMVAEIKNKMGPEDVFVFYYAGHGMMYENTSKKTNDFYLVMSDITNLYGDKEMLDNKGISAFDLLDISKNLPAQKQVFVLDACQSGAALNAIAARGHEREKALAQLARNTGTFFLTASQDIEYANEVGSLKHGIFTYAILELLNGESNDAASNETISIYKLKSYVESRVPELSKLHKGSSQYPTGYSFGNDFPLGVVK